MMRVVLPLAAALLLSVPALSVPALAQTTTTTPATPAPVTLGTGDRRAEHQHGADDEPEEACPSSDAAAALRCGEHDA